VWRRFHDFWLELSRRVPVLVVRFEDVKDDVAGYSELILQFMQAQDFQAPTEALGSPTVWAEPSHLPGPGYSRKRSTDFSGSYPALGAYSPAVLASMQEALGPTLGAFGYSVDEAEAGAPCISLRPLSPTVLLRNYRHSSVKEGVLVNSAEHEFAVRLANDKFGRGITAMRRGLTADDAVPFAVSDR
jgi:hypothetical protein